MPDERKQQSLDINITGSVDSSLARAIGVTESQLAKLKDAVATINKGFSKEAFSPAAEGFAQATEKANTFHDTMKRIGETMAGVFSADIAMEFFNTALEGARKLAEVMKEAGVMAAQMEITTKELGIEMGKPGTPAPEAEVKEWLRKLQFFSDQTVIQLKDAAEAFRGALTIPGMNPEKAFETIKRITDVASATTPMGMLPSEHFKELQETYFQALRGGNLMEKTIRPLEREGISIRPYLEQKLGIETGLLGLSGTEMTQQQTEAIEAGLSKLYKTIKKGAVPAQFLEDFFKDITSKGGKYYQASAQFTQTAAGGWSTLLDKFENVMRGIGGIELGPFEAIVNKINSSFTFEAFNKMQDFFEKAAADSKKWMDAHIDLFTGVFSKFFDTLMKQDWNKVETDIGKAAEALVGLFQKMGPFMVWLAKELPSEVDMLLKLTTAFEKFFGVVEKVFNWLSAHSPNIPILQEPTPMIKGSTPDANAARDAWKTYSGLVSAHAPQAEIDAAKKKYDDLTKSMGDLEKQVKKTTGNDFVHLNIAIDAATAGLGGFVAALQQAALTPGMAGGGMVGAGGPNVTEYGPGVAGDQPGGATYDYNSYHRIGAWPNITGPLRPGDVALGYGAQAHYHVQPGQVFTDDQGRTVRFADRSGSKNPMNEDIFRLASGGIVTRATRALIGEAGPEAVVPLNQGGLVTLTYAPTIHGFGDVAGLLREHADELLRQVEGALSSRFAAMAAV